MRIRLKPFFLSAGKFKCHLKQTVLKVNGILAWARPPTSPDKMKLYNHLGGFQPGFHMTNTKGQCVINASSGKFEKPRESPPPLLLFDHSGPKSVLLAAEMQQESADHNLAMQLAQEENARLSRPRRTASATSTQSSKSMLSEDMPSTSKGRGSKLITRFIMLQPFYLLRRILLRRILLRRILTFLRRILPMFCFFQSDRLPPRSRNQLKTEPPLQRNKLLAPLLLWAMRTKNTVSCADDRIRLKDKNCIVQHTHLSFSSYIRFLAGQNRARCRNARLQGDLWDHDQ